MKALSLSACGLPELHGRKCQYALKRNLRFLIISRQEIGQSLQRWLGIAAQPAENRGDLGAVAERYAHKVIVDEQHRIKGDHHAGLRMQVRQLLTGTLLHPDLTDTILHQMVFMPGTDTASGFCRDQTDRFCQILQGHAAVRSQGMVL